MSDTVSTNINITDDAAHDLIAAQGAGVRIFLTSIIVTNAHGTVGTLVTIKDDTAGGGNILCQGYAAALGGGFALSFPNPPATNENKKLIAVCGTNGANVYISLIGQKNI
jgi:hypothetical protein